SHLLHFRGFINGFMICECDFCTRCTSRTRKVLDIACRVATLHSFVASASRSRHQRSIDGTKRAHQRKTPSTWTREDSRRLEHQGGCHVATLAMPSEAELSQLSNDVLVGLVKRAVGKLQTQGARIKELAASAKDMAKSDALELADYGSAAV